MQHTEPIKKYLTMSKIYIYIYIHRERKKEKNYIVILL